jgi:hypothetical protein
MRAKRFYLVTRDLHLYFGLFISPFVLVFAISVFFLVHAWLPGAGGPHVGLGGRRTDGLRLPPGLNRLDGRARVDAVRPVLDQLHVTGEIGFIQHAPEEHKLVIPMVVPGRESTVELDYAASSAVVTNRDTGMAQAFIDLHKSPGPHLAAIRGNWVMTRAWRWLADSTVYLILFISASGIYMWAVLRAERAIGLVLMAAGAATFSGMVYALCR